MIEKIRKIIDKYFWAIFIGFIFAIFFVLFLMVKGAMASGTSTRTDCVFSDSAVIGFTGVWQKETCTTSLVYSFETNENSSTTCSFPGLENWDIQFNGTTSKMYFWNYWSSGDVLIVFAIFCLVVFLISKTILSIFVKKYFSINRKNQ